MTLIQTPFSEDATVDTVIAGIDLNGKRAIVTGGNSGIGYITTEALARAGAHVTVAGRSLEATRHAASTIGTLPHHGPVDAAELNLADVGSVRQFVRLWKGEPLDILVNNAGIMAVPDLRRTAQDWELQLATNYFGHAALTLALHDALMAAKSARVVLVSSSAHLMSPVCFDDLHFSSRPYDPWVAYAQSKTAMILFTRALAKRWQGDGITVNALHPGGIMTNLQRHLDDTQLDFVGARNQSGEILAVPPGYKTPEQGAATSVLLAASPLLEGVTGRYFEDLQEAAVTDQPRTGGSGLARYAADEDSAERMWAVTLEALRATECIDLGVA
jgi:NAD(P)-dependent dehydrogenase (short-subunit alcohol dehydrogenase family)